MYCFVSELSVLGPAEDETLLRALEVARNGAVFFLAYPYEEESECWLQVGTSCCKSVVSESGRCIGCLRPIQDGLFLPVSPKISSPSDTRWWWATSIEEFIHVGLDVNIYDSIVESPLLRTFLSELDIPSSTIDRINDWP